MLNSILDPNRILQKKPKQNTAKNVPVCHWNHNSLAAHGFLKLVLLKKYNLIHKFDIICLSETYLDSNILHDDSNLEIPGYNVVRSDVLIIRHIKNVEVFIYTVIVNCL